MQRGLVITLTLALALTLTHRMQPDCKRFPSPLPVAWLLAGRANLRERNDVGLDALDDLV